MNKPDLKKLRELFEETTTIGYLTDLRKEDLKFLNACTEQMPALLDYCERLEKGLRLCLPVVEAAFYDHWSAGHIPGSGYSHGCYSKLPFNWRQEKEFSKWLTDLKAALEAPKGDE